MTNLKKRDPNDRDDGWGNNDDDNAGGWGDDNASNKSEENNDDNKSSGGDAGGWGNEDNDEDNNSNNGSNDGNGGSDNNSNAGSGDAEDVDPDSPEGKLKEYKEKMATFITSEYQAVKERIEANENGIQEVVIVFKSEEEKEEIIKQIGYKPRREFKTLEQKVDEDLAAADAEPEPQGADDWASGGDDNAGGAWGDDAEKGDDDNDVKQMQEDGKNAYAKKKDDEDEDEEKKKPDFIPDPEVPEECKEMSDFSYRLYERCFEDLKCYEIGIIDKNQNEALKLWGKNRMKISNPNLGWTGELLENTKKFPPKRKKWVPRKKNDEEGELDDNGMPVDDEPEEPEEERGDEEKMLLKTIYVFFEDVEKIYVAFPGFQFKIDKNSDEAQNGWVIKPNEDSNPERSQDKDTKAIDRLDKIDEDIRDMITGHKPVQISTQEELDSCDEEFFKDEDFITLNGPQKLSIKNIFLNKFTLIQGPPGTGKTTTAAVGIKLLIAKFQKEVEEAGDDEEGEDDGFGGGDDDDDNDFGKKMKKKREKNIKILVCSDSNKAVDNLAIELLSLGVKVIRIRSNLAKMKEYDHILDKIHLHKIQQRENYEDIMDQAEVIACTLEMSQYLTFGANKINCTFKALFVDEATQASEIGILKALRFNMEKMVLIGDQQQLGPVYEAQENQTDTSSMFSRLIDEGSTFLLLKIQYRMHPEIGKISSELFYNGCLKQGIEDKDRPYYHNYPEIFLNKKPVIFINVNHEEEKAGTSCFNIGEIMVIKNVMSKLKRVRYKPPKLISAPEYESLEPTNEDELEKPESYPPPKEFQFEEVPFNQEEYAPITISIISTYKAQSTLVYGNLCTDLKLDEITDESNPHIRIDTVDAFQGQESDFVIISATRCNGESSLGFLKEFRRLNVAITRARQGLIVVGNKSTLEKDEYWAQFFEQIGEDGYMDEVDWTYGGKGKGPEKLIEARAALISGTGDSGSDAGSNPYNEDNNSNEGSNAGSQNGDGENNNEEGDGEGENNDEGEGDGGWGNNDDDDNDNGGGW